MSLSRIGHASPPPSAADSESEIVAQARKAQSRTPQAQKPTEPSYDPRFLRPADKNLRWNLPDTGQRFDNISNSEKQIKALANLQAIGYASNNPGLVSSAMEQMQALHSNTVTTATNDANKLTALRAQVIALYGAKLASAGRTQAALSSINASLSLLRGTVEVTSAQISQLSRTTAKAGAKTDAGRLQLSTDALIGQIDSAKRQIGVDLQRADLQGAQLSAAGRGEVARSDIALKGLIDYGRDQAGKALTSALQPYGRPDFDPRSQVPLPPAVIGDREATPEQRQSLMNHFFPFTKRESRKDDSLVPKGEAGRAPFTVDGIAERAGLPAQKERIQQLEKEFGNLDKAAKAFGLETGKQLTNLTEAIDSGRFDPLKLDKNFREADGRGRTLLEQVGRVRADYVKQLGPVDSEKLFAAVGKEVASKTRVPQALKDYARDVKGNVDVLTGMALVNYASDHGKDVKGGVGEVGELLRSGSTNPLDYGKAAAKLVLSLRDKEGKLTPLANALGNLERVKRVTIQYEGLQIAKVGAESSATNLENAAQNFDNARQNAGSTIASTATSIARVRKQLFNVDDTYRNALTTLGRQKGNEASLHVLGEQTELVKHNLERQLAGLELNRDIAKQQLALTEASTQRSAFDYKSGKIVRDMTDWNAKYARDATRFGAMVGSTGLYAKTPEGLIIPPTMLQKHTAGEARAPSASELRAASDETLAAFGRDGRYRESAAALRSRSASAMAAVGFFNTGDPEAIRSRNPVQSTARAPLPVPFGEPTPPFVFSGEPPSVPVKEPAGYGVIPGPFDRP
jgi:hypothetical protein